MLFFPSAVSYRLRLLDMTESTDFAGCPSLPSGKFIAEFVGQSLLFLKGFNGASPSHILPIGKMRGKWSLFVSLLYI